MTLKTVPASIAALLAASVLLAGCSDDSSGDAGGEKSSDAPTSASSSADDGASQDEGSSDSGSGDLTTANFNELTIEALREAGSYRGTTTTTAGGSATTTLESEATYEDGKPLVHGRTTAGSPQQLETVAADGIVYIKAAGLGVPAGKWLKIDPDDPANADNPLSGLAAAADPDVALRAMGDLESLELVGSETVEGVETDHYKAVMNTGNYAKVLGLPAEVSSSLPATIPVEVWIDEDNRPVRTTTTLTVQGVTSTTTQTYYDFGADIEVTVPADSETVPLSEARLG